VTSPDMHMPEITRAQMTEIFTDINDQYGLSGKPDIKILGPISFVAINDDPDPDKRKAAKLVYTSSLTQDLAIAKRDTALYQDLQANGAKLPDIEPNPIVVPADDDRGFVGNLIEYLPVDDVSPFQYGRAMGSLTNASRFVDQTDVPISNGLDEWFIGESLEYLKKLDTPFAIGQVVLHDELVELVEQNYREGNEIREQLIGMSNIDSHGTPMAFVQEDAYGGPNGNVRGFATKGVASADSKPGLIDLLPLRKGLPSVTLGRMVNDMGPHFNDHPARVAGLLAGYVEEVHNHRLPHPEEIRLAADYTEIRSKLTFIGIAIRNARLGVTTNPWMLQRGIERLTSGRYDYWLPLNDAQKKILQIE
jgi:hypothetical protein